MRLDTALATVRTLFDAAVSRVDAGGAVRRDLVVNAGRVLVGPCADDLTPPPGGRVVVVAAGKAAEPMAHAAAKALGPLLAGGVAITKQAAGLDTGVIDVYEAGHPVPDERGLRATRQLYAVLRTLRSDDLLIVLLSGGASALLTMPAGGLSLADLRATTDALLRAGADISELNAVRKHLEVLKGGGLAAAVPATVAALIVSDVLGDRLDVIASGPAVGDPTTFADAHGILERKGLLWSVPPSVLARLEAGRRGQVGETPAPGDPRLARVHSYVIANLPMAAAGMADRARELGFEVELTDLTVEGEARTVGQSLGRRARELGTVETPRCMIGGGETTVTVRGAGIGGRNTELTLAAALELASAEGVAVAGLATDGDDGATGSAGAVATAETMARARTLNVDAVSALRNNDSGTFFSRVGGLVLTGPTATNVADLHVLLSGDGT